jgi:hypothetical protein
MDSRGYFNREKIAKARLVAFSATKQSASAHRVWRKRHSVRKTIATHREQ